MEHFDEVSSEINAVGQAVNKIQRFILQAHLSEKDARQNRRF